VAPATRARVERLAREMGYRPSARARQLVGKVAGARCAVVTLGLGASGISHSPYGDALLGIMERAVVEELDVYLVPVPGQQPAAAETLSRLAAEDRADGVIVLTFLPLLPADVQPLDELNVPYVLVNRHFDHLGAAAAAPPEVDAVTLDWAGAAGDAVRRLHGLGHRRLAAIFGARDTSTLRDREQGWREGAAGCGLAPEAAPILYYQGGEQAGGRDTAAGLLAGGLPGTGEAPTAVFCFNDRVAHGVLQAARAAGVAVPEHLSVVGCDNDIAPYTFPPLCTYEPHFYAVGVKAAAVLGALLRGEASPPQRHVLPVEFIARASCGPAPGQV
jgi:LacI family transcriptional regulator